MMQDHELVYFFTLGLFAILCWVMACAKILCAWLQKSMVRMLNLQVVWEYSNVYSDYRRS